MMNQRNGAYILKKIAGESYQAFVPAPLPPTPVIDLTQLYPLLEKATQALTALNSITKSIPNTSLFIYMYVCKEALLSSQIEGTQSSFSDLMLFEHYHYGLTRLQEGFPLSLRLLREIHGVLLSGGRGATKLPGEFRRSQNWIGGTRPGNALFVPPPIEELDQCLSNFEFFLHDDTLPLLVKAAIAHVQFETIHPFLDGNGRLGRLLISLLLCEGEMLDAPILYLSLYLKKKRQTYYDLLQEVRQYGTWETWIEFFLEGIIVSAKQALQTALKINQLFDQDYQKITNIGRAKFSVEQVFEFLKKLPQVSVPMLANVLQMSVPTARSALNRMLALGIIEEITSKKRDKVYLYRRYLDILQEGAEPL